MQMAIKGTLRGKLNCRYSVKRFLYTLCFFLFCLINQRAQTCSPLDGGREVFQNLTGVVMAVIIMSHYKPDDFKHRRLPYLIGSIVGAAGAAVYYIYGEHLLYFKNARAVGAAAIFLFGFILIHTYISVFVERDMPKLNRKFLALWLVMMALMIASRSDYIWPFCYLMMFGCFYLTNYTEKERDDLFQGALDGIILSLFVFQAWCCVFRPYDQVRYIGIFSNCNHNAVYYLCVLAAVFGKLLYLEKKDAGKWLKLLYWLGTGAVYALIFMTIGRTAWIVAFLLGICFLWALQKIQQKKRFIKHGMALILTACIMFPVVFGLVRYLPPLFHHPVWFWGEWSEKKVHSWDAWDSEKFVDMDELLTAASGRVSESIQNILRHFSFTITSEAAGLTPEEQYNIMLEEGYALPPEKKGDFLAVRGAIYKYYIDHLNLFGHPYEEQGFQLTKTYWIGHAHNIYLQYGTDFGIPVMILFVVVLLWAGITLLRRFRRTLEPEPVGRFLFLCIAPLFGMFEYCWGVGSLPIVLLFICLRSVICIEAPKEEPARLAEGISDY